MLRPQLRSSNSHQRLTRSPLVKATDDDHPLLLPVLEIGPDKSASVSSAASQLGLLNARGSGTAALEAHEEAHSITQPRIGETEVFVHRVTKTDTLPKIILQYQLPIHVLRRANKLWANDSIQSKDILLIPVDACAIRPDLIQNLPPARLITPTQTQSTSISLPKPVLRASDALGSNEIASGSKKSYAPLASTSQAVKRRSHDLRTQYIVVRQALVSGIGLVDIATVPAASLSYFPPSISLQSPLSSISTLARSSLDRPRYSLDSPSQERGSFEALRVGAGQIAADAYNGTAGLIRRLKDKKHDTEYNLIDL